MNFVKQHTSFEYIERVRKMKIGIERIKESALIAACLRVKALALEKEKDEIHANALG